SPGRRRDKAGQLRRVQLVDPRSIARAHRNSSRVRRARGTSEMKPDRFSQNTMPSTAEAAIAPPLPLPTFADVESAARQIAAVAHRTLVATSRWVDSLTGARVFFKCENLQRGGAFKFRGAYNALSRLSPDARRRGVVAYSSGNHAQAIALAGQLLGIP